MKNEVRIWDGDGLICTQCSWGGGQNKLNAPLALFSADESGGGVSDGNF